MWWTLTTSSATALFPMSSPDLRWTAHLMTYDFLRVPRTGLFYSINYCSSREEQRVLDITDTEAAQSLLCGNEYWRNILTSRKSGHGDLHSTQTVIVNTLLPLRRNARASTNMVALLTYPTMRAVSVEDVHVTWIFTNQ